MQEALVIEDDRVKESGELKALQRLSIISREMRLASVNVCQRNEVDRAGDESIAMNSLRTRLSGCGYADEVHIEQIPLLLVCSGDATFQSQVEEDVGQASHDGRHRMRGRDSMEGTPQTAGDRVDLGSLYIRRGVRNEVELASAWINSEALVGAGSVVVPTREPLVVHELMREHIADDLAIGFIIDIEVERAPSIGF
jgi:hypothetical protein